MQSATPFVLHLTAGTLAANQDSPDVKPKRKRGRPPTIRLNPNAHVIRMAINNGLAFIDDAVMAGLYIAVGDSSGTLNVRPRHVRKAICLTVISTADIRPRFINNQGEPICKRTAEYLAAAARVAIGGIERHLSRNPALTKRLQAQWDRYQQDGDEWDYSLDCTTLTDWSWHEWNAA